MSRYASWRGTEPSASRRTARTVPWRLGTTHRGAVPVLRADPGSRLSEGVLVETRLTARVLGLRLLRVDGIVCLAPGRLVDGEVVTEPARPIGRPQHGPPPGAELARAAQLLAENSRALRGLR